MTQQYRSSSKNGAGTGVRIETMTRHLPTVIYADVFGVKENHELKPDVEGAEATAIDAKLGTFCISYSLGADADHIAALAQAIKNLAAHYGVEPDFVIE